MNFKNKLQSFLLLLLIIMPFNVFAYSDYVIAGGNNIGIEVNSKGILVVGFYEVNGKNIAKDAGFSLGDKIIKVNNNEVSSINNMIDLINSNITDNNTLVNFTILRDNNEKEIKLSLIKDSNEVYKTGIYVKDQITGIGTLTYIDPNTNIFGALGHEIIESNSNIKVEVKDGKIFKANVTGVNKSTDRTTGEKKAKFDESITYGSIKENTESGIFGKYTSKYDDSNLIKVGSSDEIVIGPAVIRTVLNMNDIEEYSINIIKINSNSSTKNILFEITDKRLKDKTNGIIKGMSGSPIIQNNMIIGAVTHAIVNDNTKGYGIFITTMLEEGEN
ncbi:MAG: SpoIVB peptidase S55 domain-containing protein [bacterium]|nr:SpoIVB peptidase S55 domain-containing protein [bacterium]